MIPSSSKRKGSRMNERMSLVRLLTWVSFKREEDHDVDGDGQNESEVSEETDFFLDEE